MSTAAEETAQLGSGEQIVAARRAGSRSYYRIADPCVTGFLDLGLCLLEETAGPATSAAESAAPSPA